MHQGRDIVADIYLLGDLKGKSPIPVHKQDTLGLEMLSLVEGDVDFGVPFEYSIETKKFFINSGRLNLKTGVSYKLRGISVNELGKTPVIEVPTSVQIDSSTASKKSMSDYTIHLFMSNYTVQDEYYYIQVKDEKGTFLKSTFLKTPEAYKQLIHQPGFLVDGARIQDDGLEFVVESYQQQDLKKIKVEIAKVTPSYYQYHYFYSNASGNPDLLSNPPIAALNINTKSALGSISALNTVEKWVTVR